MDREQRLVDVRSRLLQAEIRMQGMIAANKQCELNGTRLPYGEKSFLDLIVECGIDHNSLSSLLYRCNG